ncbi:MAG: hypothetical protein F6K24_15920 [Okeania sp. SIO2D1]|nr:hypothetical protein [Okeania sp. SIO2D1]
MAEKYLCKLIFAFLLLINEGRRKREEAVRPRDDASRKGMRTKRGRRVEIEKKRRNR